MTEHIIKTIEEAEERLRAQEQAVRDTKKLINQLRAFVGQQPTYQDVDEPAVGSSMRLKGDEYVGKTQHVAVKSILERRKALGMSPVSAVDVYSDLVAGGYQFETDDVSNRKRGLGQTLSRNTSIFHRLDNGLYGLVAWYPGLRKPKMQVPAESEAAKKGDQGDGKAEEKQEEAPLI